MSKRGADKPLDYDNWDAPDEPAAQPEFEQADEETLKKRKMIFVSKKLQSSTQAKRGIFKSLDAFATPQTNSTSISISSIQREEPTGPTFLSKLAILNKEVSSWISKHVTEDPHCILTPVFNDYEKHLASIKCEKTDSKSEISDIPSTDTAEKTTVHKLSFPQTTSSSSTSFGSNGFNFSFKPATTSSDHSASVKPPVFSFGLPPASSFSNGSSLSEANSPLFSFKSDLTKASTTNLTSAPFTFGSASASTAATTTSKSEQNAGEEEEYVPPKPEVKEIKEEGSVYTVRCKLFYKKADQWTERGLGNLHIIPSGDEKFQLLVRADTNLGNILLNIMVNKDIPMHVQRNNVVFACVPSPPLPVGAVKGDDGDNSPVPMLIRVKTPEAAAALLVEIDKHRGKSSSTAVSS
nr:nuclear pore complex protein nup50 [Hymenolepis microstoma]